MKFLNRIVLCTSLLLTSYLTANEVCGVSENSCGAPEGCCLPFSSGSNFFDNICFRAEGLYFQTNEDGLEYATSFLTREQETEHNDNFFAREKSHSPRFHNRLGYRVALDYCNPCSCWDLGISYLNFRTSAHGGVHRRAQNSSTPLTAAQPQPAVTEENTLASKQILSSASSGVESLFTAFNDGYFDSCGASLRLRLDILDVDIKRCFCINECVTVNPFVGFRYLRLRQKYRLHNRAFIDDTTPIAVNNLTEDHIRLKSDFNGFGIHGGLNTQWEWGCGLSVYGLFGGSLLCGSSHFDQCEVSTFSDFILSQENEFVYRNKNHHKGARATAEAGLGLLWDYCFCDAQRIRLKLGWEFLFLAHFNRFQSAYVGDTRHGDISLQGLLFGFDYCF